MSNTEEFMANINVTANRQDQEGYRLVRLERVVGYLCALAEHYNNKEMLSKIDNLHDHKGELMVTWKAEPTLGEKEFVSRAWSSEIGDCTGIVEHEILDF